MAAEVDLFHAPPVLYSEGFMKHSFDVLYKNYFICKNLFSKINPNHFLQMFFSYVLFPKQGLAIDYSTFFQFPITVYCTQHNELNTYPLTAVLRGCVRNKSHAKKNDR